ncbi:hypothetical protein MLD38_013781 [Melastoma candidum]|uniref:Uncharacterized protein n=1 Tax=Melastoma candidum TaxID=119954 RepID=A0ACB9RAT7_9MYRT|nr:hypothetical protein MLD38_013781 [Melastoma candidum]
MSEAAAGYDHDEPLTPAGRLFVQKETNQIIYCAMGSRDPIDVDLLKSTLRDSLMVKHPRFSSIMVRDSHGRERWRRTTVDVDCHVIVVEGRVRTDGDGDDDDESAVNEYLAELSTTTSGLDPHLPLWEVRVLLAHNCLVLRIHHALGDGISMMSLFLTSCRKVNDPGSMPTIGVGRRSGTGTRRRKGWVGATIAALSVVWWTVVYVLEFIARSLWVKDRSAVINGGEGVELWPRKLATASFRIDDMKAVKAAVPDATINDVLFGIISSGLFRYLDHRSHNGIKDGTRLTGVAMVNLREQPGLQELSEMMKGDPGLRWGNRFGILLLPIKYRGGGRSGDPLDHLRRAKVMLDRKKSSLEAHFSYFIGDTVMSFFGAKVASILNYRIICNTTFTISNVIGPQEEIMVMDNPIKYIRANSSSLPHALTMHMVSYAGRADMQILVAKDMIPAPKFLAKCFEEALLEMKEAAAATTSANRE